MMSITSKDIYPFFLLLLFSMNLHSQTTQAKATKKAKSGQIVVQQDDLPVLRVYTKSANPKGILGEDYPNQQPVIVDTPLARILIESAPSKIKLNNNAIQLFAAEISKTAIENFRDLANTLTCPGVSCTDWIPGISIHFAQEGSSLFLYYQPLRLCAVGAARQNSLGLTVRDYDLCSKGSFYYYDGSAFQEVETPQETDDKNTRISQYRSTASPFGVSIENPNSGVFEYYSEGTSPEDPTGNAREIIYPVGELIQLANDGSVKLWNMVERDSVNGVLYNKHNILLSTPEVSYTGNTLSIQSASVFADLSHICPPRCNAQQFTFHIQ